MRRASGFAVPSNGLYALAALGCFICASMSAMPIHAQAAASASPDQQLLHEVADLNQGVALLAHETMHRTGTFPSKADAEKVDKQHDAEMDHARAALKMLNDSYTGSASHSDSATAAALGKQSGAAYDHAFRADVSALDQREIQSIDKYLPQLTNPQIKTLAQRMRASAQQEMGQLQ
jgi:hypothetical protein